jgi:hypothetical protein
MIFKKRKDNQNKIKPPGRKRKIITTLALSLSLMFGKAQLSSSQSSSPNFGNQEVHQRLIDDREFNLLEENNQQVILAKGEGQGNPITPPTNRGLSSFSTPPPGGRPSQPSPPTTGRNPFIYRRTPRVVDQGLNAGANPAGADNGGGAPEFEENSPVPNKEQSQESKNYDYRSNDPQNKKKSKDQCPIDQPELNESFKSNSSLKKVTKRALRNQHVKREYTRMLKRIGEGVDPMDIGQNSTNLGGGLVYVRGRHGRYTIKTNNGVKDVVGIAYRGSRNDMKTLAKEMKKSYNVNIKPGGY